MTVLKLGVVGDVSVLAWGGRVSRRGSPSDGSGTWMCWVIDGATGVGVIGGRCTLTVLFGAIVR